MSKTAMTHTDALTKDERLFVEELKQIVDVNLKRVYSAINYGQVYTNWCIGKRIIEQEQKGEVRAEYGKRIIAIASEALTAEFGSGYSLTNIKNFKRFYIEFQGYTIGQTLSDQFETSLLPIHPDESLPEKGQTVSAQSGGSIELLPWSHYERLKSIPAFAEISESLRSQITLFFTALENKAKEERYIGNLKAMHTDIDNAYNNSLKYINKWIEEEANKKASPTPKDDTPKPPVKQFVQKATAMDVSFSKSMLENEADVEAYISELKKKMMDYIHQNKNIMLN